jgi:DNA phosphorothioation-associated putative methyltransferase
MRSHRHRTAISRTGLSKPVRLAVELGLLDKEGTFLDYGCGRGGDVSRLERHGFKCTGWDPVHAPDAPVEESDVVNLGYVVNVIEEPTERGEVLLRAWSLARKLLVVSARLTLEEKSLKESKEFEDGCITGRGTFQKFYTQQELKDWIESIVAVPAMPAAPGIFLLFRDRSLKEDFASSRYKRQISIKHIGRSKELFEQNAQTLEPLLQFYADRGRLPSDFELDNLPQVKDVFSSIRQAFAIVRRVTGKSQWDKIEADRKQDLTIYLALARFGGRPVLSQLSEGVQLDVKAFFGSYRKAYEEADKALFSAGNMSLVDLACKAAPHGKLTNDALYIHENCLQNLDLTLRVYEGCARAYIGNVEGANIIKLHRQKPKVSYLAYPEFDKNPHPPLVGSLVVPLRSFNVRYYDYSTRENPPILHRKEEFVPDDYPGRDKFAKLTRQEEKWGLFEEARTIGTKKGWEEALERHGVKIQGHRLSQRKGKE